MLCHLWVTQLSVSPSSPPSPGTGQAWHCLSSHALADTRLQRGLPSRGHRPLPFHCSLLPTGHGSLPRLNPINPGRAATGPAGQAGLWWGSVGTCRGTQSWWRPFSLPREAMTAYCGTSPWTVRRPPGLRVRLGTCVCPCVGQYQSAYAPVCSCLYFYICTCGCTAIPNTRSPSLSPPHPRLPPHPAHAQPRAPPCPARPPGQRPHPAVPSSNMAAPAPCARARRRRRGPALPPGAAASAHGRKARPGSSLWLPAVGSAPPPPRLASPRPRPRCTPGQRPVLPPSLPPSFPRAPPTPRPEPAPRRHPRCPKMEVRGSR